MSENEAAYTADTIAMLGYLADRLPRPVDEIFGRVESGEARLWIPSIVLGETLFTLIRGKQTFGRSIAPEKFLLLLDILGRSVNSRIHELNLAGWRRVREIDLPELHDRMIVASYYLTQSQALLTDDHEISNLPGVKTIWRRT